MPIPMSMPLAGAAIAMSQTAAVQEPEVPVQDPPPATASGALSNIQMAMVFDFRGVLHHPDRDERRAFVNEVEFGFKSEVDPFWTAEAYLALHRQHEDHKEGKGKAHGSEYEFEIEEAFARYGGFGRGVDGKLGQFKAA